MRQIQVPPTRYTPQPYRGLSDADAVRVWYHRDADEGERFKAWYAERTAVERKRYRHGEVCAHIAKIHRVNEEPYSRAVADRLAKLEAERDELAEAFDPEEDVYAIYADGLGSILRSIEIQGVRHLWPSEPADRLSIFRMLGETIVADIVAAIHNGSFDQDLVGK